MAKIFLPDLFSKIAVSSGEGKAKKTEFEIGVFPESVKGKYRFVIN